MSNVQEKVTQRIAGVNGHIMAHIDKHGTYKYSGNWFKLYGPKGAIPFTVQEYGWIVDGHIQRVVILDGDKKTHWLTRQEILDRGKWSNSQNLITKYGERFVVQQQDWTPYE